MFRAGLRLVSNRGASFVGRVGRSGAKSLTRDVAPDPRVGGPVWGGARSLSSSLSQNNELVQALSDELASEESEFEVDPDLWRSPSK